VCLELAQSFFGGREASIPDVWADLAGIAGYAATARWSGRLVDRIWRLVG
jgi:VanZ family protein